MHLVPIPVTTEHLRATESIWFPFLGRISARSGEPVASLFDRIMRGEVQPIVVWDGKEARALCGVRFYMRGHEKVGEWIWMTGTGRRDWEHLLPEMERYMRDVGCAMCQAVCRPGWSKILKRGDYKATHYVMEKAL